MNLATRGDWAVIVGPAVALATYYVVFGFPATTWLKTENEKSKDEISSSTRALKVANEACSYAPQDGVILASKSVSKQLLSLEDCPTPLFVSMEVFDMPVSEKLRRRALVRYVDSAKDLSFAKRSKFVADLRRYNIRVVVMSSDGIQNSRVKQILRQSSYEKVEMVEKSYIWVQQESWKEVDRRDQYEAQRLCQRVRKKGYALVPYGISKQLEKQDCGGSFLDHPPAAFAPPGFERRRDLLENILSVDGDPTPAEMSILDQVLDSRLIRAIILIQEGDGNLKLKNELRRYNFKLATKRHYYRLWVPKDDPAN